MQNMTVAKTVVAGIFANDPVFLSLLDGWDDNIPLCIDSRSVPNNAIFFAIKGDVYDGHDFINEARAQGASLIIAEKIVDTNIPTIVVPHTLKTFSQIAHRHLMSMPAIRIAITGSNGKTTVKEMVRAALEANLGQDAVYANVGTLNNHFGVPLSALNVNSRHEVAIFELGMNHKGEIRDLCRIVEPHLGLITNVALAHPGNFKDGLEGIRKAKGELFSALKEGHAIINEDDDLVLKEAALHNFRKKTTFGKETSDLWLHEREPYNLATKLQTLGVLQKNGCRINFGIPLPGLHHAKNAVAALAVLRALDLFLDKGALGIANMVTNIGRMNLMVIDKCLVINDGYNANPSSMEAGIKASLEFEAKKRMAVIGAMAELGHKSDNYHYELGILLAKHFHEIFVSGELALPVVEGVKAANNEVKVIYKNTSEELIKPIVDVMKDYDLMFIKGSKSSRMQVIAEALKRLKDN